MSEIVKYDISNPAKTLELASTLTKFIQERNLTSNIKGKDFVNVEGWQFAGSQLGIIPILVSLENLSTNGEYKYRAEVDLIRIDTGAKMGKGIAICSNKEGTKRNFEEYAIASMAQTRAEGKAFRMCFSWLIKAAGFEASPAEEAADFERPDMPTDEEKDILRKMVNETTLEDAAKKEAWATIDGCGTYELYSRIQARLENLRMPINQIPNPSQKDINEHLRKTVH